MSETWARLALGAYRAFGSSIYPFMGPFLSWRARRGKEERERRFERYGYSSVERPQGPVVWFHAASVGESIAVLPLIAHIDQLGIATIMTTGTVTSAEIMRARLPQRSAHQYMPLDMNRAIGRFLDTWKPDLAIFAESETWPMTVLELERRKIPQVLVNARMSDRSYKRWSRFHALSVALYEKYACVIAQSEIDAERFRELGARPVTVSGNLKVDNGELPFDERELARFRAAIGRRPCWIAASTHPGEEEIALRVHSRLSSEIPGLLTVIVPRHPERGPGIGALASAASLKVALRSAGQVPAAGCDVFVGDSIGEMGLYFQLASIAFVGRSMAAEGGQNPLEPASFGAAILSGRNVGNFRDSYRNLLNAGGARLVADEAALAENVLYLLRNEKVRQQMVEAAANVVQSMRGAREKTLAALDAYLFPLTVKRGLEAM